MHIPKLHSNSPKRGNFFSRGIGWLVLKISGFEYEGEWPDLKKCVIIVAPHTSNWDFIVGLSAAFACQLSPRWLGKDTLFKSLLGWFFYWQGGIPAVREHPQGLVGSVVEQFKQNEKMWLVIAPEGTRSKVSDWRSGFYHIAHNAQVPILPIVFDWPRKKIRILPAYTTHFNDQATIRELKQQCQNALES
ncbi:MAG: 1-acyl-sn-glycerol-3-phosphate acyltransferase [bacterium]